MRPRAVTSTLLAATLMVAVAACGDDTQEGVAANEPVDGANAPLDGESTGENAADTADPGAVAVYFLKTDADMTHADSYEAVTRTAGPDASVEERLDLAVRTLAEGPDPEERERGLTSPFTIASGQIRGVTFRDGTVIVDFSEGLTEAMNFHADNWGPDLLAPLNRTVFEIAEAEALQLWGEGSCETFVSWGSFELQEEPPPDCIERFRRDVEDWKSQPPPTPQPDFPVIEPEDAPQSDESG